MSNSVKTDVEPLVAGDKLDWDEFIRRWEGVPEMEHAELVGGVVYMPSPVSMPHAKMSFFVGHWLHHYAIHTPGCEGGTDATWRMGDDGPQPDAFLRILPSHGGQSDMERVYPRGAPELLVEVSLSSEDYDLHQKKKLYETAGVREYVVILLREREVRWFRLTDGKFAMQSANENENENEDARGVIKSAVFPGLWLDVPALLAERTKEVLSTLQDGIASDEHAEFVRRLQAQAESKS